jgi:hypothetical protein
MKGGAPNTARRRFSLGAFVKPRQAEFAVAEQFGRRQFAIGGTDDAIKQSFARIIHIHLPLQ